MTRDHTQTLTTADKDAIAFFVQFGEWPDDATLGYIQAEGPGENPDEAGRVAAVRQDVLAGIAGDTVKYAWRDERLWWRK